MTKLSVIILSYNTVGYTTKCLQSIQEQNIDVNTKDLEVIVIDNASSDSTVEQIKKRFPWVRLIVNKKNLGFAAGNNVGIKVAKGKYILLLNSDTVVLPDTFEKLLSFIDKTDDAGAVTARLELADGALDLACHRGFPTPWNALTYFAKLEQLFANIKLFSGYHQTWKDFNTTHQVDAISGACFLTRKKIANQIGLLDEQFFMYAEDIDWCMRIKQAGWKVYYYPNAKVIHYKKRSGRRKEVTDEETQQIKKIRAKSAWHFYETMKLFYEKHYAESYPSWMRKLVLSGVLLLTKIKIVKNKLR